jgi:primosomal protein N' (replication factor Y)
MRATHLPFVEIAVNVPAVSGVFHYHLPDELTGQAAPGCLVTVPFGTQTVQGVILRYVDTPSVADTKPVLGVLDPDPLLNPAQIALAEALAESTLNPLAAILDLMLPPGLSQQADVLYSTVDGVPKTDDRLRSSAFGQLNQTQHRLLKLLQERGPLRGRQIDRHFAKVDWRKSAEWLVKSGLLAKKSVLPPPSVRPKMVKMAQLAVSPEIAEAALPTLGKTEATLARRGAALRYLIKELDEVNVSWVYAASSCNLSDLQILAEMDLIFLRESEIWRDPTEMVEVKSEKLEVELTPSQKDAWEVIKSAFADSLTRPLLLKGVTGSGKTELYIRAAQEAIRRGRQAIILIPEIALTPQTVRRFLARFPGQVGVVHSKLSAGERYDTWRRARAGLLKLVIGPRSALFTPLPNIGLIVADECHDSSYYQSEPPFYHAVEAAKVYARLCGAVCLLGSATPTVEQQYQAQVGESVLLELPERVIPQTSEVSADFGSLPPIRIVDMREELKSGNRGIFSRDLAEALAGTLERGEQAILFLNRRGTATYVFCRSCGHVVLCPQCDTPLTFHVEGLKVQRSPNLKPSTLNLICHRCGYARNLPKTCPNCKSTQIRQYGLGSERVEAEVTAMLPKARTLRWDWETTRQKDAHEIILSHFAAGRADVLVGTQMLAKGLDLPKVTLVGIVLAEVGLNLPDPFAAEQVFQVLTQVAGRAGRSALGGKVVLQTFQPEHYAIRFTAGHDVDGFYRHELAERQRLGYPPYAKLVRLEYRHADPEKAEAEARRMAERLMGWLTTDDRRPTTMIGPVPCFFAKIGGIYRWQIILRGPNPAEVVRDQRFDGWRVEVGPVSLL